MEFWYQCRANPRKSNHSYLRLLQASPAILLAWFTYYLITQSFQIDFAEKSHQDHHFLYIAMELVVGTKTGEILCVVSRTYPYHDRTRKTLHTKHGFPLEILSFSHSKHLFSRAFWYEREALFVSGGRYIWSLIQFVDYLPGDLDHPDRIEWMTNQKNRMCWGLNSLFWFPVLGDKLINLICRGLYSRFIYISIIRTPYTHYKDDLFKGWDDHPQEKELIDPGTPFRSWKITTCSSSFPPWAK